MLALASAALVAGCGGGGPSAPVGWQPVQGAAANTEWSSGSGDTLQTYRYERRAFAGSLQELTSQQATSMAAAVKGAHFEDSDAFPSCPGQAAVANFTAGKQLLIQGVAVRGGTAVVITYSRPAGGAMPPEVAQAMAQTLCSTSF